MTPPAHRSDPPVADFTKALRRRGLAANSIRRHVMVVQSFRRWLGRAALTATAEDIQSWLDTRDIKSASRVAYIKSLHAYYEWAVEAGNVKADPTATIVRPRVPRRVPRPIASDDLRVALADADPRMRLWLLLASYAGLRCCEIAGLRRSDILEDRDPPVVFVVGKGSHERTVPLHPAVLDALAGYGLPAAGYLFPSPRGGHLKAESVSRYIAAYLHRRGVRATAHQGRHAFATNVYRKSKDLRLTQELLGHASPMTTAIYAACDMDQAAAVVLNLV